MVVVQRNVELRVVGVLVVADVESLDYIGDWGYVQRKEDGPQDRTLGNPV